MDESRPAWAEIEKGDKPDMTTRPVQRESYADAALRQLNREKMERAREQQEIAADLAAANPIPESSEIMEINELIAHSRYLAETNRYFAAARSLAAHRPVLPLEPGGLTPMVPVNEASQDLRTLLDWWAQWPEANTGTVVGRHSNLIALRVTRVESLIEYATIVYRDEDTDATYSEVQEIGGARVAIGKLPVVVQRRGVSGWGKRFAREATELLREDKPKLAVQWFVWEYPRDEFNLDTLDFPAKHLAEGLDVLGTGEVLPLSGVLLDGTRISNSLAPGMMQIPSWLASRISKPRRNGR
jgi:hypothetical protein